MAKPKTAASREKQMRFDLEFARKVLMETGQVMPQFMLHGSDGKATLMATPWDGDDSKDAAYRIVAINALAVNAVAISFIGEAWQRVVERLPGETVAEVTRRGKEIRPSQSEDRREIVVIEHCYRDDADEKHSIVMSAEIQRRADGRVSGLAPAEKYNSDHSRIADCLPPCAVPPRVQEVARKAMEDLQTLGGVHEINKSNVQ